MEAEIQSDRIELRRTNDEKAPLVQRLNRIEGQVRGVRAMIEGDRYCQDEILQINAITAGLREVALLIIGQHVDEGLKIAEQVQHKAVATEDIRKVLRSAMKLCD